MRIKERLWLFILILIVSPSLWCQTLYVTLSDSHSNYDNLIKFLQIFETKVENFKIQHPGGNVVLLVNGDYGGASGLASVTTNGHFDAGMIGLETLKGIAQNNVKVIFNSGNHEAHDFASKDKHNQRYVEQMKFLNSSSENLILIGTNQNFLPHTGLDRIFKKRFDYEDPMLGKNRILGLTLQNLETKSSIDPKDKIITAIEDYESNLTKEIELAIKDHVSQITIMIHDETPLIMDVALKMESKYKDFIHFNAWIAGHDHKEARLTTQLGTPILNAGSQFGFMDWKQISNHITLSDVKLFEMTKYSNWKERRSNIYKTHLAQALQKVRLDTDTKIQNLKNQLMGTNHGPYNIKEGKLEMKATRARTELGLALANSMRTWVKNETTTHLPVVGVFNTSSYRVDQKFGQIELTDLQIVEMYPFIVKGKIHKLTGAELLEIVQKTILFQENVSAIQLSANLRLITDKKEISSHKNSKPKTIEYPVGIEIYDSKWRPLQKSESIVVGVDDWTAINGYKNTYSTEYLIKNFRPDSSDLVPIKKNEIMLEILQTYLPTELKKVEKFNLDHLGPTLKQIINPPSLPKAVSNKCHQLFLN